MKDCQIKTRGSDREDVFICGRMFEEEGINIAMDYKVCEGCNEKNYQIRKWTSFYARLQNNNYNPEQLEQYAQRLKELKGEDKVKEALLSAADKGHPIEILIKIAKILGLDSE